MEKIVYLEKRDQEVVEPEPRTDEERIDTAVRWINRKVANTVHFGLIQIGFYLLHTFFDGSIENALSKSPKKGQSFRRLCRRPDLVISSTHLTNAVKLVTQEKALAGDRYFASLPVSHKIALLPLDNTDTKRALALRTLDEGLSVRALNQEVKALRKQRGLPQQAWSRRLRRALETVRKEMEAPEATDLSDLGRGESEALKNTVKATKKKLEGVLARLPEKETPQPEKTVEQPVEVIVEQPPEPLEQPALSVDEPMEVIDQPAQPVEQPMEVIEQPALSVERPMEVTDQPAQPVEPPREVIDQPAQPVAERKVG